MTTTTPSIRDRIAALDWAAMTKDPGKDFTGGEFVLTSEKCTMDNLR